VADFLTEFGVIALDASQPQKAFIDAVDFLIRAEAAQDAHHPIAHIGIKRIVAAVGNDPVLFSHFAHLIPRFGHRHAQRFDFIAARHRTTIVIRQHHHRLAFELGLKHALAGNVEIVHIDERNHCGSMIQAVITPQMFSSCSSRRVMGA